MEGQWWLNSCLCGQQEVQKKEKRKKGRHKEENTKELDYFSKGIDFYTDFGAPTIRDYGEYWDKIDTCIISAFIKRSQPKTFTKGAKNIGCLPRI